MCLAVCSIPDRSSNIHLNNLEYFLLTFTSKTTLQNAMLNNLSFLLLVMTIIHNMIMNNIHICGFK